MATGDTKNVLEECLKKINANTAQLERFLRQVFTVFMLVMLKVVAASFTVVLREEFQLITPELKLITLILQ